MHQALCILLLVVSFGLLCSQLYIKNKQPIHLLFAVFCGSIAVMAIKQLSGTELGLFQYLLGMGVCMTCNGYWLVARALFRQGRAIFWRHLLVAASVAMLIIGQQALQMAQLYVPDGAIRVMVMPSLDIAMQELLVLLSSSMLMLTVWEGCRGYRNANLAERRQRQLFLLVYLTAVCSVMLVAKVVQNIADIPMLRQSIAAGAAIAVLLMTQWLIYQRFGQQLSTATTKICHEERTTPAVNVLSATDSLLCDGIQQLFFQQQLFLQANLRLTDVARLLDVPEYRISKLLRSQFAANNFNQFINTLRIEHAKKLLADPTKSHWPVLVIGMESGFATAGPFTRAFKTMVGFTPHEYRQTFSRTAAAEQPAPTGFSEFNHAAGEVN